MTKNIAWSLADSDLSTLSLDEVARVGAQEMLRIALEAEVSVYLEKVLHFKTPNGKPAIVRNGYHRRRGITVWPIPVNLTNQSQTI